MEDIEREVAELKAKGVKFEELLAAAGGVTGFAEGEEEGQRRRVGRS